MDCRPILRALILTLTSESKRLLQVASKQAHLLQVLPTTTSGGIFAHHKVHTASLVPLPSVNQHPCMQLRSITLYLTAPLFDMM